MASYHMVNVDEKGQTEYKFNSLNQLERGINCTQDQWEEIENLLAGEMWQEWIDENDYIRVTRVR